jgi:hypothetical protein
MSAEIDIRNVDTGDLVWRVQIFKQGGSVSVDAAGRILQGEPELIERELVYVVETADGRQETLKPSEFETIKKLQSIRAGGP